ncbi:hypothetical protein Q4514_18520, partial [Celeribacter halophilus]|nr:hypothetical protein [Celeribacter halophilus]
YAGIDTEAAAFYGFSAETVSDYAFTANNWYYYDSTSMFPDAATEVTKLGYFRQLSTEGVLAQQPSMLLGASATGPAPMLEQVANAGVD